MLGSDFGRERLQAERGNGEFSYTDQYQRETMLGGGGMGKRKMRDGEEEEEDFRIPFSKPSQLSDG